ncbi:MAG: alpha-2-macroglobulin, partial [Planctomycetaceae bacterium]|nr:alpha-2-macroglobulin [Planctomycetaceae bacterium]
MQRFIFLTLTVIFFTFSSVYAEESVDRTNPIAVADQLIKQGLHKDALDLLRSWILDPKTAETKTPDKAEAIVRVCRTLQQLNRVSETDEFLEKTAEIHKTDWKMLSHLALSYTQSIQHNGYIIDGKFQRGPHRGGGQWVNTAERDRIRALQLLVQAMPLVLKDNDQQKNSLFFLQFAEVVMFNNRLNHVAWKLQTLTDLNILPDYETQQYWGRNISKAPVDADGNPVYYHVPESWETAKNDGERWRWLLDQAEKQNPDLRNKIILQRAQLSQSQFGEQTLLSSDFFRNQTDKPETTASILNLETLGDDETIAQLATGIKRFKIPDEFNYIALYKNILETNDKNARIHALGSLAEIYKNRRQFFRAVDCYKKLYADENQKHLKQKLDQIIGNWGRFEFAGSKVAGLRAELCYVFRNGKKVNLTAHEINAKKLIEDIKTYLQSKPQKMDWNKIQIDQIGWRLINDNDKENVKEKYLGKEIAKWSVELQPAEKHFNRATTISVPIQQAGVYLIRAEMENGNAQSVVLWLNDTAIVQKMSDNNVLYFVADSQTGEPVAGAEVKFFGYKMEHQSSPAANNRQRQNPLPTWTFENITKKTDENGFAILEQKQNNFQWLVTTTDPEKKCFAHLGFSNLWFHNHDDQAYQAVKTFIITDRPVYRPKDTVKIKAWIGTTKYDLSDINEWAGKTVCYEIYNPRGEKIVEQTEIKLDAYGGMTTELELSKEAMLGVYYININNSSGNFRVEEYKKPEYEVTIDTPKEPVKLGDTITATIQAKYYFGSPVTDATVKYKILREKANDDWYPIRYWDWLYGCGYSWFAYNSPWFDGWTRWGCFKPLPPWMPRYSGPPEIIAEQEVKISEDGTVKVVIDTKIAKEIFPNDNQRYMITAEVIDQSRRTIVGTGNVLVAKEPFKIYAWTDCGFYRLNQKIVASFQARRLDGKPISGEGTMKLYKINYENNNAETIIKENEIYTETIKFNEDGRAQIPFNAAESGQYRISCTLNNQEGGYVFNIYPQNNSENDLVNNSLPRSVSESFKYNALELIPDKAEFTPGENVTLRINTERENSFVVLFMRAANNIVFKPQLLRLNGKSHEISIPVELRDMPNFFVEALTISDGEVINEIKEIVVPPQKKILNVEIKPSAEIYKPNEKATAELVVTDLDGKPVSGQITVSIYDKSVEYISGGSHVGEIKEFFWKWRRQHNIYSSSNLLQYF